jgi:23S rRNA pseudouridine1911/1915/1917 synthase
MKSFNVLQPGRLDMVLSKHDTKYSRSFWCNQINGGAIKVNDKIATKAGMLIKAGDKITYQEQLVTQEASGELKPAIIFENKDVLVINKPANLITISSSKTAYTLTNWLKETFGKVASNYEVAHRLDKDTSGVLIIAKNNKVKDLLQNQFKNRTTVKEYLALVEGCPKQEQMVIDLPIKRSKLQRDRFVIDKSGRSAKTEYEVIACKGGYSFLKVHPATGRTHQIRVHLKASGHPIVGDILYGSSSKLINRQCLHAYKLTINLPGNVKKTFTAPVAQDILNVLKIIKINYVVK